jgi:hypothetical protein
MQQKKRQCRHEPRYADAAGILLSILIGGLMIFLFPWHSPLRATVASGIALLSVQGTHCSMASESSGG